MDKMVDCDNKEENVTKGQQIMDNLTVDKHVTEEEFQNFMVRVTEVGKHYFLLRCKRNIQIVVIF